MASKHVGGSEVMRCHRTKTNREQCMQCSQMDQGLKITGRVKIRGRCIRSENRSIHGKVLSNT